MDLSMLYSHNMSKYIVDVCPEEKLDFGFLWYNWWFRYVIGAWSD